MPTTPAPDPVVAARAPRGVGILARIRLSPLYARLATDTLVYAGAGMAVRSVTFLVTPILTRVFPREGFATIDLLLTGQAIVVLLAGFNLDTALARYYFEYAEGRDRPRLVSTLLAAMLAGGVMAAAAIALAARPISGLLFDTRDLGAAVALAGAGVPVAIVVSAGLTLFRFDRRPLDFVVASLVGTTLQLGLTLAVVWLIGPSVAAVVAAQVTAQLAAATLVVVRNRHYVVAALDRACLKRALRFSLPQVPSVAITWYLNSANRFFLLALSSLAAVASFAAAAKVPLVLMAAVQAFLLAFRPFALSLVGRPDAPRVYANILHAVVGVLSVGTVATAVLARPFLTLYAGPAYAGASTVASILVLSVAIGAGFGMFFALALEIAERTAHISAAQVVTFLVNSLLNLVLIPLLGAEGAALAVLGGSIAQALVLERLARPFYPLVYDRRTWLAPAAAAVVIVVVRLLGAG